MYGTRDLPQQREKAHAEHGKELLRGDNWLEVHDIGDHIESEEEQTGPITWKLCASATRVGDEVEFRCRMDGSGPPGCCWVAATFFLYRYPQPLEGTVVDAKLVDGDSTYCSAEIQFVYREKAQNLEDYRRENENYACSAADLDRRNAYDMEGYPGR
ncbi:hypothetical protein AAVH_05731 [Aphelenchoides avenae]|nr:hypothetical protein AAVH_05731 [Aphelenchus avenae]